MGGRSRGARTTYDCCGTEHTDDPASPTLLLVQSLGQGRAVTAKGAGPRRTAGGPVAMGRGGKVKEDAHKRAALALQVNILVELVSYTTHCRAVCFQSKVRLKGEKKKVKAKDPIYMI